MTQSFDFQFRLATVDDADAISAIYNQTIVGGGYSPQLQTTHQDDMRTTLRNWRRQGNPVWVFLHEGKIIAWSCIHPIVWGPELCFRTADFSVYVERSWYGQGVAIQAVLLAFDQAPRHGFESISAWILSKNRKSSMLARAFRLQRWGVLPQAAHYGDDVFDVEIWGRRYSDVPWVNHVETLRTRIMRRAQLRSGADCETPENLLVTS